MHHGRSSRPTATEVRDNRYERQRWNMNRTTKKSLKTARWVCLALTLGGCGSVTDTANERNDDERVGQGQFAFTTPQPNACANGCVGGIPNSVCEAAENNFNCAQDCACGDGLCNAAETPQSCPVDCKYGTDPISQEDDFCGNNHCEPWEWDGAGLECALDCKIGTAPAGTTCGNATCEPGETSATCPGDCGNKATCGYNGCEPSFGETFATCDADCINFNVPAGRFVKTVCYGYDLYSSYSDGNGGFVDHLVTELAGGCDPNTGDTAYPWKLITNAQTCNGSTLLKPDGTTCTINNANCVTDTTSWASLGAEYVMASDPNKCGTFRTHSGNFQPVEWAKVGMQNCAQGGCTVYQCGGQSNTVNSGTLTKWRPQIARWSIYANKCQ
jgi:hypothetical protein